MSETQAARATLAQFCSGLGLDIGFGGSSIVDSAITFDLPKPYACYQDKHKQILKGDCRDLSFICDNALDYIYSSHVLEDFTYVELVPILTEWRRTLKPEGLLITNCPDQQKYESFCKNDLTLTANAAHKERDFSLETFKQVAHTIAQWETIFEQPEAGAYSWYLVLKKIA